MSKPKTRIMTNHTIKAYGFVRYVDFKLVISALPLHPRNKAVVALELGYRIPLPQF